MPKPKPKRKPKLKPKPKLNKPQGAAQDVQRDVPEPNAKHKPHVKHAKSKPKPKPKFKAKHTKLKPSQADKKEIAAGL